MTTGAGYPGETRTINPNGIQMSHVADPDANRAVYGSIVGPVVPPQFRRFKRPDEHISPEKYRKALLQRELAVDLCLLAWIGMVAMLLLWNIERTNAIKLRKNLAASCAVNPVPPWLWQPKWSDE